MDCGSMVQYGIWMPFNPQSNRVNRFIYLSWHSLTVHSFSMRNGCVILMDYGSCSYAKKRTCASALKSYILVFSSMYRSIRSSVRKLYTELRKNVLPAAVSSIPVCRRPCILSVKVPAYAGSGNSGRVLIVRSTLTEVTWCVCVL